MDYLLFSKIRAYCRPDLAPYLDTPEKLGGTRLFYERLEGSIGVIKDESAEAINIIHRDNKADNKFTARVHAAAVLFHIASECYLATFYNKPAPLLPKLLGAIKQYAAFLPEPEREALLACVVKQRKGKIVERRRELIRDVIAAIKVIDTEFDKDKMPGTRANFFELCQKIHHKEFSKALATFMGDLKGMKDIQFHRGARHCDYYKNIAQQIGVTARKPN